MDDTSVAGATTREGDHTGACWGDNTQSFVAVVRRWWPLAAIFAFALLVQEAIVARHVAKGHATGHLESAKFVFLAAALVATIVWARPAVRRQVTVLLVAGTWLLAAGAFSVGHFQVVDAMDGRDWTTEEADRLGAAVPGFESGHDLSGLAAPIALLAALALAVVLFRRGVVSKRVAIGACIVSVVWPYFLMPGAGVVVLAVAACLALRSDSRQRVVPPIISS